jgi:hypothetical protein
MNGMHLSAIDWEATGRLGTALIAGAGFLLSLYNFWRGTRMKPKVIVRIEKHKDSPPSLKVYVSNTGLTAFSIRSADLCKEDHWRTKGGHPIYDCANENAKSYLVPPGGIAGLSTDAEVWPVTDGVLVVLHDGRRIFGRSPLDVAAATVWGDWLANEIERVLPSGYELSRGIPLMVTHASSRRCVIRINPFYALHGYEIAGQPHPEADGYDVMVPINIEGLMPGLFERHGLALHWHPDAIATLQKKGGHATVIINMKAELKRRKEESERVHREALQLFRPPEESE